LLDCGFIQPGDHLIFGRHRTRTSFIVHSFSAALFSPGISP
jgi:hypothetical protein